MKKIILGCAAVLLSLGLLAGCNNDTDSAVTISVDNTATVVVGKTLELPYTVEPEKAKVEVLNDHEEYVTAEAEDGVLTLEGLAAGSATVTLVGTYKKYAEANVSIAVSVVTEGEVDQEPGIPETGGDGNEGGDEPETLTGNQFKLGVLNENLYTYYYFDGTLTGSNTRFGGSTENWEEAVTLTMETTDDGTTLSWEEDGTTYYLGFTATGGSGEQTALTKTEEVAYLAINETYNSIEDADGSYFLGTYNEFTTFSWNGTDYYEQGDFVAHLYQEAQANPEKPEVPELEVATTLTSGQTYYLGCPKDEEDTYFFDGGNYSNNYLTGSTDFSKAVPVTATESDSSWILTCEIDGVEHTIYTYLSTSGQNTYCEVSTVATTELESALSDKTGASTFTWDSTYHGVTVTLSSTQYFLSQNYNSSYAYEFGMSNYNSYKSTNVWINFYSVVEA